jgi:hypothetical protein
MGNKKTFYVTTPIYYPSNKLHIVARNVVKLYLELLSIIVPRS